MRAAISVDHFSLSTTVLNMANLTNPPSLVPPATIYRDYFSHTNTNSFCGRYAAILDLYMINPADTAPDNVARLIYAAEQEGFPAALLKCHQGKRWRSAQIAL